MLFLLI